MEPFSESAARKFISDITKSVPGEIFHFNWGYYQRIKREPG
jgi:hypothetical protein